MANQPLFPNGMESMTNEQLFGVTTTQSSQRGVGGHPLGPATEGVIQMVTIQQLRTVLGDQTLANDIFVRLPSTPNVRGTYAWMHQMWDITQSQIDVNRVESQIREYPVIMPQGVHHYLSLAPDRATQRDWHGRYMAQAFLRTVLHDLQAGSYNDVARNLIGTLSHIQSPFALTGPLPQVQPASGINPWVSQLPQLGPLPPVLGGASTAVTTPQWMLPSHFQTQPTHGQPHPAHTLLMGPPMSFQPQTASPFLQPAPTVLSPSALPSPSPTLTPPQRQRRRRASTTPAKKIDKRLYCPLCGHKFLRWNDLHAHLFKSHARSGRTAASWKEDMKKGLLGPWTEQEARQRGKDRAGINESEADLEKRRAMEKENALWADRMRKDPKKWEKQAQEDEGYPNFQENFTNYDRKKKWETREKNKKRKGSNNDEYAEEDKMKKGKRSKRDEEDEE